MRDGSSGAGDGGLAVLAELGELGEAIDGDHPSGRDQRGLGAAGHGDDDRPCSRAGGGLGHRHRPGDRPDRAVERQLPGEREIGERALIDLTGGGEHGGGEREIEAGARLAQVRRSEIGGDPLLRELEAGVDDRRPDPLARLADGGVGQADERERRQADAHVGLDPDLARLDAEQRVGANGGGHPANLGRPNTPVARRMWRIRRLWSATCALRRRSVAAMTAARQSLGRQAEQLVAERLRRAGWRIVARNVRPAEVRGEIDLIGVDGTALVFVEVKSRRSGSSIGPEIPAMAVGRRKQAKLRGLAAAWLRERGYDVPRHRELRFDVIGLRLDAAGRVTEYEHLRAAF